MVIISGVQPSGALHLGNYFGAIREHIALQHQAESYFLIADLHALTTQHDGRRLRENTRQAAIVYLACGLDSKKAALYRQSDLTEVCELNWILNTVTPMSLLERAVAYKEARQRSQSCDAGLFNYPVLMAADILIIGADVVPVGRDQLQHIEIAREIARSFSNAYQLQNPLFPIPEARLSPTAFVPGIDREKMSKRYSNAIGILDEADELRKKVSAIVTDSKGQHEAKDPETCTVYSLLSLLITEAERNQLAQDYRSGAIGYKEAKDMLYERLEEHFRIIRQKCKELNASPAFVDDVLADGHARARKRAQGVLAAVRNIVGLGPNTGG